MEAGNQLLMGTRDSQGPGNFADLIVARVPFQVSL